MDFASTRKDKKHRICFRQQETTYICCASPHEGGRGYTHHSLILWIFDSADSVLYTTTFYNLLKTTPNGDFSLSPRCSSFADKCIRLNFEVTCIRTTWIYHPYYHQSLVLLTVSAEWLDFRMRISVCEMWRLFFGWAYHAFM